MHQNTQQFDSAERFTEKLAAVSLNGKYGYIDKTGKMVIEPKFSGAGEFHEELASVCTGTGEVCKYGYIDRSGNIIIEPRFDYANPFSGGLAIVEIDFAFEAGYIDRTGSLIIKPKFEDVWQASDFSEGLALVVIGGGRGGAGRGGDFDTDGAGYDPQSLNNQS